MRNACKWSQFTTAFGAGPDATSYAPGRVNLMGEHTDYHQGLVLPTPLPQLTTVWLHRRADRVMRVVSSTVGTGVVQYVLGDESRKRHWLDYVQGATWVLAQDGYVVDGCDLTIASTVPPGAGVSSSAALCVSLLRVFRAAFTLPVDDFQIARMAQRIETDFVGAPVGIMDQMVCSLGLPGDALFLDTRTLQFEQIPLPPAVELVVINSGIAHDHANGGYADRRRESFEAAEALGVQWLRDATPALLAKRTLPERLLKRARHVIAENQRVLQAADALRNDDPTRLGRLFNESQASMRDDFQTSTPEIDVLSALGQSDPDVYGARLTGGGFGGSVVMLAKSGSARLAADRIASAYQRAVGRQGTVVVPPAEMDVT
jgi:galactokinase